MAHTFSCTSLSKLTLSGLTCSQFLSTKAVKPFALFCIEAAELYWRDSVSLPVISASTGMELPARIEKTCLMSVPCTRKESSGSGSGRIKNRIMWLSQVLMHQNEFPFSLQPPQLSCGERKAYRKRLKLANVEQHLAEKVAIHMHVSVPVG
jgi:hypothetical protein